jgi:hypothetical protein
MTDDDDKLDYLKFRLYRDFGVEVRQDLQVRAGSLFSRNPVAGCSRLTNSTT